MCRNHRTIYACHHFHEQVTLCGPAVAPLIRRATVFPYSSPTSEVQASSGHDVILTAVTSAESCIDCQLPTLDVFNLDQSIQAMQEKDGVKPNDSGSYRISVTVENTTSLISNGAVIGKTSHTTADSQKSLISREGGPAAMSEAAQLADEVNERIAVTEGHARNKKNLQIVPTTSTNTFVPYTGGLGLLVTMKSPRDVMGSSSGTAELSLAGTYALNRYMNDRCGRAGIAKL